MFQPSPRPISEDKHHRIPTARELLRLAITRQVVPRLIGRTVGGNPGKVLPCESAILALAGHVLEESIEPARELLRTQLRAGVRTEDLYLHLIAPVARLLGRHWESDTCDYVEVTWGVGQLHQLLREHPLSRPSPGSVSVGQILLCPMPGEQHILGLAMVAEFLLQAGWRVQRQDFANQAQALMWIKKHPVDVAAISVGHSDDLPLLAEFSRALRAASVNRNLVVLAGGAGLEKGGGSLSNLGLDAVALSASEVPDIAKRFLSSNRCHFD
jgi:methanogenic corrinoid protein MtbC1